MCGIAGILNRDERPVSTDELHRMCAALRYRGPDDEGVYLGTGSGIAMRRLSIIDLQAGRQPIGNEDGSVWVVLNGEIYNYRQLRADLVARGHIFRTESDTEVIVHLYEDHGVGCVEKLRGMFALAVWDERCRKLLLARDRLGIKPLYYAETGSRFVFASELKAILQLPDVNRNISWPALNHLAAFMCTPGSESIVRGVRKLEPGHKLIAWPGQRPLKQRYWEVKFQTEVGPSEEDFADRLRQLLEESIKLHMVSDVPLGAFLSGGIDSSAIVAYAASASRHPLKTFSVGFSEQDYNELHYARLVAKRFGADHHEVMLTPDIQDTIEDIAWHLDEPFGDPSAIPTYAVSRLASQHVKVILSGDGGDELFAGYDKYQVEARERRWDRLPRLLRRCLGRLGASMPEGARGRNFLRHRALEGAERCVDAFTLFRIEERKKLFRPEVLEMMSTADPLREPIEFLRRARGDWLSNLQALDMAGYLPLDILTKVDRMSMAHSLEARVPLLDHVLVEFAATIPPDLRLSGNTGKRIFRRALSGILPSQVLDRPKQGFAVPLSTWFRGQLGQFARDLLLSRASRQRGILNPLYIDQLLTLHQRGRPLDLELWTIMSFELWCRTFLDRSTPRAPERPSTAALPYVVGQEGVSDVA